MALNPSVLCTKDAETEREDGRESELSRVEKVEVGDRGRERGVKRKQHKE